MKQILVLGIGNQLMMDDGVGVYVVNELKIRNTDPEIRYVIGETDVEYCLGEIEKSDYIIIVDAACFGLEPCTVSTFSLDDYFEEMYFALSFHDFNLLHAMKQNDYRRQGMLVAIEASSIMYSIKLSKIMEDQFSSIVSEVEDTIKKVKAKIVFEKNNKSISRDN